MYIHVIIIFGIVSTLFTHLMPFYKVYQFPYGTGRGLDWGSSEESLGKALRLWFPALGIGKCLRGVAETLCATVTLLWGTDKDSLSQPINFHAFD